MNGVVLQFFNGVLDGTHTLQQLDSQSQLLLDSFYFCFYEVWVGQGGHLHSLAQPQARSVSHYLVNNIDLTPIKNPPTFSQELHTYGMAVYQNQEFDSLTIFMVC